jgi:hypothetical protein
LINRLLHGGHRRRGGQAQADVLSIPFLKKFIEYVKVTQQPKLTEEVQHTLS